jgi:uncharacterized protein
MADALEARLIDILRSAPGLMQVLTVVRDLGLPDWLIFSGAVYQPVLNHLTGRPIEQGLKDYDVGYFDDSDTSYEAEDVVIQRVAAAFEPPLREMVEVRNQARVHLWFEDHFGEPYDALFSTTDALDRFVSPLFAVGASMETDGQLTIVAPFGLEDLFGLRLRPNPGRDTPHYNRVSEALQRRWPELTIEP